MLPVTVKPTSAPSFTASATAEIIYSGALSPSSMAVVAEVVAPMEPAPELMPVMVTVTLSLISS